MRFQSAVIFLSLTLTLLLSPAFFTVRSPIASAQFGILDPVARGFSGIPFGGLVGFMQFCPCNASVWVEVGPPRPMTYVAFEGQPIYEFGLSTASIHPGQWNLGLVSPVGECLSIAKCAPIPAEGTLLINPGGGGIGMLGTSI